MQEKLLILRKRNNYSQQFIADKLSISVSQYGSKERGRVAFTSDEMFLMKDLFDCPLEDIFLPRGHQIGDRGEGAK